MLVILEKMNSILTSHELFTGTETTLSKITTELYTHIDKTIDTSIAKKVEQGEREKEKKNTKLSYNVAIALKAAMCR